MYKVTQADEMRGTSASLPRVRRVAIGENGARDRDQRRNKYLAGGRSVQRDQASKLHVLAPWKSHTNPEHWSS